VIGYAPICLLSGVPKQAVILNDWSAGVP
jgi:hypothetical protein